MNNNISFDQNYAKSEEIVEPIKDKTINEIKTTDNSLNNNDQDELMELDTTINDDIMKQNEIKNTIIKKIQNTKNSKERELLNSLLRDIETNKKLFEKGFDEKIVLPVSKNTRLRQNLQRRKVNYEFNKSIFDDEVDNFIDDKPVKFNLDDKNEWEHINKNKKIVKKKKNINNITKKNVSNKSLLKKKSKKTKDLVANSSIFLHNIKSKDKKPPINSKIFDIPEVKNLINNAIEKKTVSKSKLKK
jgi:hypothetical protein